MFCIFKIIILADRRDMIVNGAVFSRDESNVFFKLIWVGKVIIQEHVCEGIIQQCKTASPENSIPQRKIPNCTGFFFLFERATVQSSMGTAMRFTVAWGKCFISYGGIRGSESVMHRLCTNILSNISVGPIPSALIFVIRSNFTQ